MSTKPLGWIITARHRNLGLYFLSDAPRAGVLMSGGIDVVLFLSYEAARNAVRRTCRYAQRHGYTLWPKAKDYQIFRVWPMEAKL